MILELTICPLATLLPSDSHSLQDVAEWTAGDRLIVVYSYGLLAVCTIFLAMMVWFLLSKSRQISTLKRQLIREQLKRDLLKIYKGPRIDLIVYLKEGMSDKTVENALAIVEEETAEDGKVGDEKSVEIEQTTCWSKFKDSLSCCRKTKNSKSGSNDEELELAKDTILLQFTAVKQLAR